MLRTQQPRCEEAQAGLRRHPTGRSGGPSWGWLCLAGRGSEPASLGANPQHHQTTLADTPYTRAKLPASASRAPDSSQPRYQQNRCFKPQSTGMVFTWQEIIGAGVLTPVGEKGQVPALFQLGAPASRGHDPGWVPGLTGKWAGSWGSQGSLTPGLRQCLSSQHFFLKPLRPPKAISLS